MLLLRSGVAFVYAHAIAASVAIVINLFLSNVVTHRDRRLQGWNLLPGLLVFFQVCALGALSNFALAKVLYSGGSPWFFAGITGMAVISVRNYSASAALSWRRVIHHRATRGTVQLQSKSVIAR